MAIARLNEAKTTTFRDVLPREARWEQARRRGGNPPDARIGKVGFRLCLEVHEAVTGNS